MSTDTPKLERQEVVTQRFTWSDGNNKCGAGELLCAITVLTESQKEDNFINAPEVTDYLKEKGLIEETGDHRFKSVAEKKEELVALGDQVSEAIGDEINNLPVNTEIKLAPSVFFACQTVPMFCQKQ